MKIQFSQRFRKEKLSWVDRKIFERRIKELKTCNNLGELRYGRLHALSERYTGTFGLRLRRFSRLILVPTVFDPEYINRNGRDIKYYILGVKILYSPNHYKSYF